MATTRNYRTGRKSKYEPELHKDWARNLAMKGLIDKEIAKKMNIARSTLSKWKIEYPDFSDALKTGKQPADSKVIMNLFKRANGYTYKQKKVIIEMDKEGNPKPSRVETTDITVQGDVGAQCFWLKNRLPEEWRDSKTVDVSVNQFEELLKAASADDYESKDNS